MCSTKTQDKARQKIASVLVLQDLSTNMLILTKRSLNLPTHPGEICFPGGRWQRGDENLYSTALRELQEELGIASSRIHLDKAMQPVRTLSGFIIYPWLATIETIIPYSLNPQEVSEIIQLPLAEVKNPKLYQKITITKEGMHFSSCQYTATRHFIWGATARIMKQLGK
jgi:8-oxo-dGTP pyrophosphatase MutT (NUDIX family)